MKMFSTSTVNQPKDTLTRSEKRVLDKAAKKMVKEYKQTLKLLAKT